MGGSYPGAGGALNAGNAGYSGGATPTGSQSVVGADGKPMAYDTASMAGVTAPTPTAPAGFSALPSYATNWLGGNTNAAATAPTAGLIKGGRTSLMPKPVVPPKVQTSSTPVTSGVTPGTPGAPAPLPAVHNWGGATLGKPGTRQGPVDAKALAGITDDMWTSFIQNPDRNSEGIIRRLSPGYSNVHYGEKLMIPELMEYAVAKLGPAKVQAANARRPMAPMTVGDQWNFQGGTSLPTVMPPWNYQ